MKTQKQNIAIAMIVGLLGLNARAQMTAEEGLKQLKTNIENSHANQADYQRNMVLVQKNIDEISKAKSSLNKNKEGLNKSKAENREALNTLNLTEIEIKKNMEDEKRNIQGETAKIKELEETILKLRAQMDKREQNLVQYKSQLDQTTADKNQWLERDRQAKDQEAELLSQQKKIQGLEATWHGKKKGYEAEVQRWGKEADKHQKFYDNYANLAK